MRGAVSLLTLTLSLPKVRPRRDCIMALEDHSGFSWEEAEDRVVLSGSGLRLTFARMGGHWTHLLGLAEAGGLEIVRAVETDPLGDDAARVVSPLYQDLHRHDLAAGPGLVLLLTGRLDHHHFSAAVSLHRDREAVEGLVLDFDVADRCRAPMESLSATYTVGLDSGALVDAGPARIAWWPLGPGGGQLELLAEAPGILALAEAGRGATRVQALATIAPGTFTQRLRYHWRWTSPAVLTR
jgi:hypothetical protein